jgi:microcystin-dependent protein
MSFNFPPKGWAFCAGQLLPINQNQALFSLLGTTYGGDGRVNFGLPDLRGRAPMHMGQGHTLGERGGEENHTVILSEMPAHTHFATADVKAGDANAFNPTGSYLANTAPLQMYSAGSNNMVAMYPQMVTTNGGSQAHSNQQPYLTLNFCIALQGIFPSQN